MSYLTLSTEPHENRPILLLDLVWTLAHKTARPGGQNYSNIIRKTEEYRDYLIDKVLAERFYVIILTARSVRHQEATLENILARTEWLPDACCFNELECEPPKWKEHAFGKYIAPRFGQDLTRYFALESNGNTRAMYSRLGIKSMRWEDYCRPAAATVCPQQLNLFDTVS